MKRKPDIRSFLWLAAACVVLLAGPADAASSECERLRRAIADSERAGQNSQYQAAAERQRAEISRTVAYARQIGCENKKFLFFGSDPPAQCAQITAQIGRMRDNLEDLQSKGGGGGGGPSADLVARYNAQCSNKAKAPGVLEALFGQPKSNDLEEQPLAPGKSDEDAPVRNEPPVTGSTGGGGGEVVAGGKAVCVRSCDGAFFPISYSASSDRVNSLSELCRALCPNSEVTVYTLPGGGEIEQAVSVNGARYMESPTALRYRRTYDPACTCRRRGQTWNDALAGAEGLLGKQGASDIIVTAAKSAELSRPKADPKADAKAKSKAAKATTEASASPGPTPKPTAPAIGEDRGRTDQNGIDTVLRDAAEAISRDGSGIADPATAAGAGPVHEGRGRVFDQKGADGAMRKVRVVGD